MKINFGKEEYWKYGAKKFSFYMIVGVIGANIPFLTFGMAGAIIPLAICSILISTADVFQLIAIENGIQSEYRKVFSPRYRRVIIAIFLITLAYIIGIGIYAKH